MNLTLLAELYKQSHITIPHQPTSGFDARTEDTVFVPEKFAELIINECAEQIVMKGTDWIDFAPSQNGIRPEYYEMAQLIKQHFGIVALHKFDHQL